MTGSPYANADVSSHTFPGLTRDLEKLCMTHRGPGSSPGKYGFLLGGVLRRGFMAGGCA
jgi:hypothetical protein